MSLVESVLGIVQLSPLFETVRVGLHQAKQRGRRVCGARGQVAPVQVRPHSADKSLKGTNDAGGGGRRERERERERERVGNDEGSLPDSSGGARPRNQEQVATLVRLLLGLVTDGSRTVQRCFCPPLP